MPFARLRSEGFSAGMPPAIAPRSARDRLIVALDVPTVDEAGRLVARLGESVTFYKIGMQLVFAGGLTLIPDLTRATKRVFLDMKLLDIDNTVESGVRNIARLGATFTTIHAYPAAMRAAVAAAEVEGSAAPGLLAVTVLTSMDDADLAQAGYEQTASSLVATRSADARKAGMDGIVCSPREAAAVRAAIGPDMTIVTPGVRPQGFASGDQKRVMGPREAIQAGADYIVVGRPVSASADPAASARGIVAEIGAAL